MAIEPGLSKPGDHIELRAEMPVIAVFELPATPQPRRGIRPHPNRGHRHAGVNQRRAIMSISRMPPRARAVTPIVVRAGSRPGAK
jgi:uncharacterized protein YcgI (DUF1989 family)